MQPDYVGVGMRKIFFGTNNNKSVSLMPSASVLYCCCLMPRPGAADKKINAK